MGQRKEIRETGKERGGGRTERYEKSKFMKANKE
jgi:hypothetical protein